MDGLLHIDISSRIEEGVDAVIFLDPLCHPLHKTVPRFSFGMMIADTVR